MHNAGSLLVEGTSESAQSLVEVGSTLLVGSSDLGILDIEAGGEVRADDNIIAGFEEAGIGIITVAGSGSFGPSLLDSLGGITIGFVGDGTLFIKEDAAAICDFAGVGGTERDGLAVLGVDNAAGDPASWTVNGDMFVGTATLADTGTGQIILHNGANISVDQKLTVFINGSIGGNGTFSAQMVVRNSGGNGPGNSVGTLIIESDYEQTATGKLTIEALGIADGEFDLLHVTGNAALDGTLEMLFPGAYLPKTGDSFQFLQIDGTIGGEFAEVTFPQLLPGFQFDMMQVPGGVVFTANSDAVLAPTFLLNISTRLQVGTDENVLIGGFILQGTEPKTVLIRAIGPSLEPFGVVGALADPTLELHDGAGALIGQNDNWRATQTGGVVTEDQFVPIFNTGLAPSNDTESAIIATLDPGLYTAIIAGANDSTGIGLAEVYDLGPAAVPAKLANISTRGFVQTGDDVMIGGFIIGNQTSEVLVRGIGPPSYPLGSATRWPIPPSSCTMGMAPCSPPTTTGGATRRRRLMRPALRLTRIWRRPSCAPSRQVPTPPSSAESVTPPASVWSKPIISTRAAGARSRRRQIRRAFSAGEGSVP